MTISEYFTFHVIYYMACIVSSIGFLIYAYAYLKEASVVTLVFCIVVALGGALGLTLLYLDARQQDKLSRRGLK